LHLAFQCILEHLVGSQRISSQLQRIIASG